jgi:hypothetical protein
MTSSPQKAIQYLAPSPTLAADFEPLFEPLDVAKPTPYIFKR